MSIATQDEVAAEYGPSSRAGYGIDHLVPLELGGANVLSNRSNRPDRIATVRATGGALRRWQPDASGCTEVDLEVGPNSAEQRLMATVGGASCSVTIR